MTAEAGTTSPGSVTRTRPEPRRRRNAEPDGCAATEQVPDGLARCGPDDIVRARDLRAALLRAARGLVAAIEHDPDLADCPAAGCALAAHADPPRCSLAHHLARVEDGPVPSATLEVALRVFDAAVQDAVEAVRRCRQTEHPIGRCWFSPYPDVDGCGEILRIAHRLG